MDDCELLQELNSSVSTAMRGTRLVLYLI